MFPIDNTSSLVPVTNRRPAIAWTNADQITWHHMVLPGHNGYRKTSNIRHTLTGNEIVESLRCSWSIACRRCSNYIFILDLTNTWLQYIAQIQMQEQTRNILSFWVWCGLY